MERPDPAFDDADWALLLGPGEDLTRLAPLLEGLLEAGAADPGLAGVEWLDDLSELFGAQPQRGRLVLHAAWLPLEDIGLVRRFLDARPAWDLVLIGRDPGAGVPRQLARRSGMRWYHEPLDIDQLDDLLAPPGPALDRHLDDAEDAESGGDALRAALDVELEAEELEAFRAPGEDAAWFDDETELDDLEDDDFEDGNDFEPRDVGTPELTDDLDDDERPARAARFDERPGGLSDSVPEVVIDEEIERILSQPPQPPQPRDDAPEVPERPTPRSTTLVRTEMPPRPGRSDDDRTQDPFGSLLRDIEGFEAPAEPEPIAAEPELPESDPATPKTAPAPYFKQQVADLADIALRVELSLEMARERAIEDGDLPAFDDLELEVQRLSQFTRTLGYLAAPPAAGRVQVGLAKMVEEMLAEAGNDDLSPRYLWRTDGPLDVRCDKTLMHHALEAVLYLVHHCAGESGTVRVEGREHAGPDGPDGNIELTLRFPAGPLAGMSPEDAVVPYALRATLPELGPNALAAAAGILRGQGGELRLLELGSDWLWRLRLPRAS